MADGPESTVTVRSDSSGAQSDIKGLGSSFGGLFSTIASGAAVGGVMGAAVTGALGAIGEAITAPYTAIKGLVSSTADLGDKFFTMGRQTGQSVAALSAFDYVGKQAGVSVETMANAAFRMGINIETGGKRAEAAFKAIGTSSRELRDLKPEEQFVKVVDGLGQIPDAGQRAAIGFQIFGRQFKEIAGLTQEDLAGLMENARTFGLVLSDEMAAAGDEFGDTMTDLHSIFDGLRNVIGFAVLPVVNAFVGTIRDEAIVVLKMLKDTFGPLFGGFGQFKEGMETAGKSAETHTLILKGMITIIAGVVDAFAGLVRASGFVIGVYYDMRTAGNLLLQAFGKIVEGVLYSTQQIAIGMSKVSFGDTAASFRRDAAEIGEKLSQVRKDLSGLGQSSADLQAKKEALSKTLGGFADKLNIGADALRKQAAEYKGVASETEAARPALKGLGDDFDLLGDSADKSKTKINEFAQTATKQIADLQAAWAKQPEAIKKNDESIGILVDKYVALRSKVTNKAALPAELEALAQAFGKIETPAIKTQKSLDELLNTIPKVGLQFIPELTHVQIELDKVGERTINWSQVTVDAMNKQAQAKEEARKLAIEGIDRVIGSLTQLAQIAPGAMGTVVTAISGTISATKTAFDGFSAMKDGASQLGKGSTLAGLGSMASGIGAVISAGTVAFNVIKKLFGAAGRQSVVEFAESMGGFDALHNKLLEIGDEGERLWIKLTQGVGRNNPEQARQVIEEVTEALDKQKEKQEDAQVATEEGALATIETATQASEALKTLNGEISENEGAWVHWSGVAVGEIKKVAGEVNAISFGHSPGGIKEWKPMLSDAMGSFSKFATTSVDNLRRVKQEVDTLGTVGAAGSFEGNVIADQKAVMMAARGGGGLTIQPGAIVIDRPILKDREAMDELAIAMAKRLKEAWGSQGVW